MRVKYTGGLDSVRVPLSNGRVIVADRLVPVDFRDEDTPQLEPYGARERDAIARGLLEGEEWEQVEDPPTPATKAENTSSTKAGGES